VRTPLRRTIEAGFMRPLRRHLLHVVSGALPCRITRPRIAPDDQVLISA